MHKAILWAHARASGADATDSYTMNHAQRGYKNKAAMRYTERVQNPVITRKSLRLLSKWLPISLMAAVSLASAQPGHAIPAREEPSNVSQNSSNQPDFKSMTAMLAQADKLRKEGQFEAAATIWQQILAISEKILGQHHPHVATILNNLAGLLRKPWKTQ